MSSSAKDLPLVSICIPAYNHERYVQATIQSVIDQDYPRIELIVIDDGSKDSSWAKIEEMRSACEERFERVVLKTRENRGCAATCLELAGLAMGDIEGEIASDDAYAPGAIRAMVNELLCDPKVGLVCGINEYMDDQGRICYAGPKHTNVYEKDKALWVTMADAIKSFSGIDPHDSGFGTYEKLLRVNHVPNGYLKRRSMLKGIVSYTPKAPLEDWWFHLQFSKVCKYKYIDQVTFRYRRHATNTVRNGSRLAQMADATIRYELECLRRAPKEQNDKWRRLFDKYSHVYKTLLYLQHIGHIERQEFTEKVQYAVYFRYTKILWWSFNVK